MPSKEILSCTKLVYYIRVVWESRWQQQLVSEEWRLDPHQQLLLEEVIWMLSQPLTMRFPSLVILLQLSIIHASSHSRVSRSTLNNHFVDDHCEGHFQVESSMIIRTEDSISMGAVFLNETQVKTSKINTTSPCFPSLLDHIFDVVFYCDSVLICLCPGGESGSVSPRLLLLPSLQHRGLRREDELCWGRKLLSLRLRVTGQPQVSVHQ